MAELKKCPFCGGEVKIIAEQVDARTVVYEFICLNLDCGSNTYFDFCDEEEAIEAWNNRATEEELRASVIDEFAEALNKICAKRGIGFDHEKCIPLYVHEDGTWHSLIDDVVAQMKGEKEC